MLEKMMNKLMEEEHKRIEREEISRELYLVEKERKLAGEAIKLAMKKKRTARQQLEEMVRLWLHCGIFFFFFHSLSFIIFSISLSSISSSFYTIRVRNVTSRIKIVRGCKMNRQKLRELWLKGKRKKMRSTLLSPSIWRMNGKNRRKRKVKRSKHDVKKVCKSSLISKISELTWVSFAIFYL